MKAHWKKYKDAEDGDEMIEKLDERVDLDQFREAVAYWNKPEVEVSMNSIFCFLLLLTQEPSFLVEYEFYFLPSGYFITLIGFRLKRMLILPSAVILSFHIGQEGRHFLRLLRRCVCALYSIYLIENLSRVYN